MIDAIFRLGILTRKSSISLTAFCLIASLLANSATAQSPSRQVPIGPDPFLQIDDLLPTPNESRLASGAPGPAYWQQKVSYKITATLDEDQKMIRGREKITYENHSPHQLEFLWLQMDVNQYSPNSDAVLSRNWASANELSVEDLQRLIASRTFDGATKILGVEDASGKAVPYTIVKGLLRVDLPTPLQPGQTYVFSLRWEHAINNTELLSGRGGYEPFKDGNSIFALAHWYPRLCAYTDYGGWRVKQFLGSGEFTLEFGDFDVELTVPADHMVSATGALQNPTEVLSPEQVRRFAESDTSAAPVFIITAEEADAKRKVSSNTDLKTWHFTAQNVRDFAFGSSRMFVCDAWGRKVGDRTVRCLSLYPREGMPLWDKYSTHAIAQTIEVYSEVTGIPYPWPHATAVMGVVATGMEYPMINFNRPRPEKDGTYSKATKNRVIGVIIHETGHNWFPMIVNNDERHWMWMDEGLNSFVQRIAEHRFAQNQEYEPSQPSLVTGYLTGSDHQPIMTQPDNLQNVGSNAYRKTAAGLVILRESVLGRDLFDYTFKTYCRRWAFKRPIPSDLFRSFEDASGTDLDWFWRGWFYSTASCDQEITSVTRRHLHDSDPAQAGERQQRIDSQKAPNLTVERNAGQPLRVDQFETLKDFYNDFDPHAVTEKKQEDYKKFLDRLTPEEKETLKFDKPLYEVRIHNNGTLPMPLVLKLEYDDQTSEIRRYPAEIWRLNNQDATVLLISPKPLVAVTVDPYNETADSDYSNNRFPPKIGDTDLKLIKPEEKIDNPIRDQKKAEEKAKGKATEKATETPTPESK